MIVVIGPNDADRLGVAMTVLTLAGIAGSALAPRLGRWGQQRLVQLSTATKEPPNKRKTSTCPHRWSVQPVATVVSGWLCERFSPPAAFAAFAALLAVILLVTFLPAARQP